MYIMYPMRLQLSQLSKNYTATESAKTFLLKLITLGLSFFISILLARALGASGYGIYSYALSWVNLLAILAILGLDRLLVKETAANIVQRSWPILKGLLAWGNIVVLVTSAFLTLLAYFISYSLFTDDNQTVVYTLWVSLILLPLTSLTKLRRATLQGLKKVAIGNIAEDFVRPLLFLILLTFAYFFARENIQPTDVMWMNVIAYFTAFLVGAYTLLKFLPADVKRATPEYHSRLWLKSAFTFSIMGILSTLGPELRVLMLGSFSGTNDVGLYSVAMRGAELISLPLMVLNGVLAPIFASLYKQNDMVKLQNIVTKSAQAILVISTPLTILLLVAGDWFLSLFGSEFKEADGILKILCIGSLFNAMTGSVGLLLTMTGHEHFAMRSVVMCFIVGIILNLALIPFFGATGAALVSMTTTVAVNVLYCWWVYKLLDIWPTAFRFHKSKHS